MAESLHDLLLQSFGGVIRIFPAVPDGWKDASFYNLRTEGAFLVSAQRKDGNFRFAQIESLAGEPLTVACGCGYPDREILKRDNLRAEV